MNIIRKHQHPHAAIRKVRGGWQSECVWKQIARDGRLARTHDRIVGPVVPTRKAALRDATRLFVAELARHPVAPLNG